MAQAVDGGMSTNPLVRVISSLQEVCERSSEILEKTGEYFQGHETLFASNASQKIGGTCNVAVAFESSRGFSAAPMGAVIKLCE